MTPTTQPRSASDQITEEVTSWPGVEAGPGSRGEFAFTVGRRQIGHLHGDRSAHFSFPKQLWVELTSRGESSTTPSSPASRDPPRAESRRPPTWRT
jgi:hypothetical protein